jgi:hypothetical protein
MQTFNIIILAIVSFARIGSVYMKNPFISEDFVAGPELKKQG